MNQKTRHAITAHGQRLLALYPHATETDPITLCKRLRRIECEASRYAERLCNDPTAPSMDSPEHDRVIGRLLARVARILGDGGPPVHINLDPRGYALKIDDTYIREHHIELYSDWGGYGIIAPNLNEE